MELTFYHDSDGLDYISAFQSALRPFGLYVEDLTEEGKETIVVRVVNVKPQKEWAS